MSRIVIRILTCDGTPGGEVCGEEIGGDVDLSSHWPLIARASRAGWTHPGRGRNLCPACTRRQLGGAA